MDNIKRNTAQKARQIQTWTTVLSKVRVDWADPGLGREPVGRQNGLGHAQAASTQVGAVEESSLTYSSGTGVPDGVDIS